MKIVPAIKMNNGGYTILELTVVALIGGSLLATVLFMAAAIRESVYISNGVVDLDQKGRIAVSRVTKDVRGAAEVLSSGGGYTTDDDTLVLSVPSINANGNLIDPENTFDIIIYNKSGRYLVRIVDANSDFPNSRGGDSSTVVGAGLDKLTFSSSGGTNITVTLEMSASVLGVPRAVTSRTSATLRNQE